MSSPSIDSLTPPYLSGSSSSGEGIPTPPALYGPMIDSKGEARFSVNLKDLSEENVTIAMKSVSEEQNAELIANNGRLGFFESFKWKAVKIDPNTYILLNINSLKQRLSPFTSEAAIQQFISTASTIGSLYTHLETVTAPLSQSLEQTLSMDASTAKQVIVQLLEMNLSPIQIASIISSIKLHAFPTDRTCIHISPKNDALLPLKLVKIANQFYLVTKQQVGEGGFKKVRRAVHLNTGIHFAYLKSKAAKDVEAIKAEFRNICHILQQSGCSDTVAGVIENSLLFTATKVSYLAPLATGDLKTMRHSFSRAHEIRFCQQIMEIVVSLHRIGIAHRDLKLANFLIFNEEGGPKIRITDFGLIDACRNGTWNAFSNKGSYAYISPETCHEHTDLDRIKIDAWSLGVILYQLIYEEDPIWFSVPQSQMRQLIGALTEKWIGRGEATTPMDRVIENLLKINPDERWTSEDALKESVPAESLIA